MNNLHGSVRTRAEAVVDNFPVRDKEGCKKAFDILIQRVVNRTGLSADDLTKCHEFLHGSKFSSENRGTIEQLLIAINKASGKLSGTSNDPSVVQTVADVIFRVYNDQSFGDASESIGLLLSNYLMGCANRAFMIFQQSDLRTIRQAANNQNSLRLWVANRYRDAFQQGDTVLLRAPNGDNVNTMYIDPASNRKVQVQWNDLVHQEREWRANM